MNRIFEHINGNQFKVSEVDLNADSSQFDMTKMEEDYAFQYYKNHILEDDVKYYNMAVNSYSESWYDVHVRPTTKKEVLDKMKKIYHGHAKGILGTQIEYRSVIHQNEGISDVVFKLDVSKEKIGVITLRYWHTFARIALKHEIILESIEPAPRGWGIISKLEEDMAVMAIKRIWVPKAVIMWNKIHRKYKVTTEEVLKGLKKTRHDSKTVGANLIEWNRSDIIHYQYSVPGMNESMTFMIHRFTNTGSAWRSYKNGTLMAGYYSGTALFEEPVIV